MPFSSHYLRIDQPLPVGLRDASGRLLLGAGQRIADHEHGLKLSRQQLFAEEAEFMHWRREVAAAAEAAALQDARAREPAGQATGGDTAAAPRLPIREQWQELVGSLDLTLRGVRPGTDWRQRLFSVHARARGAFSRRPDDSFYHLVFEAGRSATKYSCHHALLTLLMCEEAAAKLGWQQPWIDSLGRAALTMNVAMLQLQDQLAMSELPPTPAMRAEIDKHPEAGAQQLERASIGDPLTLAVVRLHHDATTAALPLGDLAPEHQLARLLRRVDIFAAKISRRSMRQPMSPVQAAREACLGPGGVPDEIGGALLKAVGMYPPGSFVELSSGEVGIVLARGARANQPVVAALVASNGSPLGEPLLRDTTDPRCSVKLAVATAQVRVQLQHERLLAMRR